MVREVEDKYIQYIPSKLTVILLPAIQRLTKNRKSLYHMSKGYNYGYNSYFIMP